MSLLLPLLKKKIKMQKILKKIKMPKKKKKRKNLNQIQICAFWLIKIASVKSK
jgi:hypothetical protein